ncbi:hypothetical protein AAC387_Pa01g1585 [Persea americana]
MADPLFEPGRPGEYAVELGRIVERGLKESREVDTESLCVLAGRNLVDAANIAALAALMTFRRPECTPEGDNGQEVTVHPPEVIDPTHYEEAVMRGRMTATINASGDVCAVQKAGGEGFMQSVIMQCMRVASLRAADLTSKIKNAVEACNTNRALKKIKRHSSSDAREVDEPDIKLKEHRNPYVFKEIGESLKYHENRLKEELDRRRSENDGVEIRTFSSQHSASISGENVKKSD